MTSTTTNAILCAFATVLIAAGAAVATTDGPPQPKTGSVDRVETTFESVDATVSAQWEFPERTPAPLIVLFPASESVDRNGLPSGYGEDPSTGIYARFARDLLAAGFAVFRYDPPGTGRSSSGRFCTVRSTALEAYTRAVDHPKVDRAKVFLVGHSSSTDSIAGIYPRYESVVPPAGAVMLANMVGETDAVRVTAPVLIVVSDGTPDEIYRYGQFPTDARKRKGEARLDTTLEVLPGATETLLTPVDKSGGGKFYSIDPRAVDAILRWLRERVGLPVTS